jgi:hypothetical protein
MTKPSSLTARQQFWAEHLRVCANRGQALSSYAAEQGLSVAALYEAKSQLRRKGLLPTPSPRFVRVQAPATTLGAALPSLLRVSLPNGVVVESAGNDLASVLSAAARLP